SAGFRRFFSPGNVGNPTLGHVTDGSLGTRSMEVFNMEKDQEALTMERFVEAWGDARRREDFRGAVDQGIAAYFFFRAKGHVNYTNGALALVSSAISTFLEKEHPSNERSCSFCGRSGADVRL